MECLPSRRFLLRRIGCTKDTDHWVASSHLANTWVLSDLKFGFLNKILSAINTRGRSDLFSQLECISPCWDVSPSRPFWLTLKKMVDRRLNKAYKFKLSLRLRRCSSCKGSHQPAGRRATRGFDPLKKRVFYVKSCHLKWKVNSFSNAVLPLKFDSSLTRSALEYTSDRVPIFIAVYEDGAIRPDLRNVFYIWFLPQVSRDTIYLTSVWIFLDTQTEGPDEKAVV